LASWRGTRLEVTQVLHRVCENVLRDPTVSEQVLVNRAKVAVLSLQFLDLPTDHNLQALHLCGTIFTATKVDESDAERRELEILMAEAAAGKSKVTELRKKAFEESQGHAMEVQA
jgi:X-domain of DnaJ-containing